MSVTVPFDVRLEPELPPSSRAPAPFDTRLLDALLKLDWGDVEYDLIFEIGGLTYGYYPDEVITVMGSIVREIERFRSREDHTLLIIGYPVLDVRFEGDMAVFLDPTTGGSRRLKLLGVGRVPASVVLAALDRLAWSLWDHVQGLQGNDGKAPASAAPIAGV
jgi:hypothetical protein